MNNFDQSCRRKGRTVSAKTWSETDNCIEHANKSKIQCGAMFRCMNGTFSLGDLKFPTSRPD